MCEIKLQKEKRKKLLPIIKKSELKKSELKFISISSCNYNFHKAGGGMCFFLSTLCSNYL